MKLQAPGTKSYAIVGLLALGLLLAPAMARASSAECGDEQSCEGTSALLFQNAGLPLYGLCVSVEADPCQGVDCDVEPFGLCRFAGLGPTTTSYAAGTEVTLYADQVSVGWAREVVVEARNGADVQQVYFGRAPANGPIGSFVAGAGVTQIYVQVSLAYSYYTTDGSGLCPTLDCQRVAGYIEAA